MRQLKALATGIVATAAATWTFAIPFEGSIAFSGDTTLDSGIETATAFDSFDNAKVGTGTQSGAYVGTGGTTGVSFSTFSFDPLAPAPVDPIWSFTKDMVEYSFRLDSITSVSRDDLGGGLFALAVAGIGVGSITGWDDTAGAFSITSTGRAGETELGFAGFAFTTTPDEPGQVPDSGATAALLGLSVLGLTFVARRRAAAA